MRKSGILQGLVAACGAIALGIACLVAAPTPAHAATYTTPDGIAVEADTYTCEQGHRGTISSVELKDYSWNDGGSGNELRFRVLVVYHCPECNRDERRESVFHTLAVTCSGDNTTTFGRWHDDGTDDSITFKFSVASGHHDLEHVAAVDATCENEGNVEYWECRDCHKLFLDAAGTQETSPNNVVIPEDHDLFNVDGVTPTMCGETGVYPHVECRKCHRSFVYFGSYLLEQDDVTFVMGHTITDTVEAKAPTCTEAGNVKYYVCGTCHKKFADDRAEHELTDDEVTIAPVAHTFENGVCTVCGVEDPNYQAQGNDPADKPQGEKPAGNPAGKLPAVKPVAGKPTAATKLGAAKLLPQTGEEAAPIAAVLALGVGAAVLGIRRRRLNN